MHTVTGLLAGVGGLAAAAYALAGAYWVMHRVLQWRETRRQQAAGARARQRERDKAAADAAERLMARIDEDYRELCEREGGSRG